MIRVLPDHLINQIAAGEVIERPASVVKELLENSVDAGARSISIDIESGGRRRIRVADDGVGLNRDDALMALERHATSKLGAAADLARIVTLGFRGEALPAIASVSRLTLITSMGDGSGTRVDVEGGVIRNVVDAAHPRGTTVDVRDLFFNTPARAKFLRTSSTELGHISELVAAFCLSIPAIRLTLQHEGRKLLELAPTTEIRERLRSGFGQAWSEAISFSAERGALSVFGLILPPDHAKTSRRAQRIYVNGRLVKDRLIAHAIAAACEARFPKDRHAEVVVLITCPPEAVDVNVHPAKAEVRFVESRLAHDLVANAVSEAVTRRMPVTGVSSSEAGLQAGASEETLRSVHEATRRYLESPHRQEDAYAIPTAGQRRIPAEGTPVLPEIEQGAVALAHYRESYILAEDAEGLLIIDQHAAHERILYERLLDRSDGEEIPRQGLLFPLTVAVSLTLAPRLEELLVELDHLGFTAEPFGERTLVVREAPSILDPSALPGLLSDLMTQLMNEEEPHGKPVTAPRNEKLLATVACHAAIKVKMALTPEKMRYIARELFRTSTPLKCPHGRPAVLRFTQVSLEKGFDRR